MLDVRQRMESVDWVTNSNLYTAGAELGNAYHDTVANPEGTTIERMRVQLYLSPLSRGDRCIVDACVQLFLTECLIEFKILLFNLKASSSDHRTCALTDFISQR